MRKKLFAGFLRKENGQSMAWFALTLTVVLCMGALVVDVGRPALEARRVQNAADSAALAAGQLLPLPVGADQSEIRNIVYDYAAKNGYTDTSKINIQLSDAVANKYRKISVTIDTTQAYYLAQIMGNTSVDISRAASVKVGSLNGIRDTVPIAIKRDVFEANVAAGQYDMILKYGGGGGTEGDYGAVDPDGSNGGGANDYRERLANGYHGALYEGDVIYVESGNMSGPTQSGIANRFASCTHSPQCTYDHYDKDCPRVMLVPIVHVVGNKELCIDGFAPFILTSGYVGSGNECEVQARYIPGLTINSGEFDDSATDYGIYGRKIVD